MPEPGRWSAEDFVARHLAHLLERRRPTAETRSSLVFRGGQRAADEALRRFALDGYAEHRRAAYPQPRRSVSRLSPWIRHGLLSLQRVWDSVEGGPSVDVDAFRQSLLWQEYARHLYARLGPQLARLASSAPQHEVAPGRRLHDRSISDDPLSPSGWDGRLGCLGVPLDEMEEDGWLVDEGRRWLAAYWTDQLHRDWRQAEDYFHRHLLDGSRAANRVAWLQSLGHLGATPATFTRWDVEELAPGLCASCEMVYHCPVERPRPEPRPRTGEVGPLTGVTQPSTNGHELDSAARRLLHHDPHLGATTGPLTATEGGSPEQVWLTAESLGDHDPAAAAHPDLPVVFVFDEPLLRRLRLSAARLTFMVESLAELATRRPLELWLGDPTVVLAERRLAATFTPVPGWQRRAAALDVVVRHPWPWLKVPRSSRIDSFTCWKQEVL